MIRATIAVIAGIVAWAVVATGMDLILRATLSGYAVAEPQLHFTLGMMLARLAVPGAVPSLAAGFITAWISRGNGRVVILLGIVLFLVFLPSHYALWPKFPWWYHLTFLGSIFLLTACGAVIARKAFATPAATIEPPESVSTRETPSSFG